MSKDYNQRDEHWANGKLREFVAHDGEVTFTSYYKYYFSYRGEAGGITIILGFGGSSDDIYKESVDTDPVFLHDNISAMQEEWVSITIRHGDDEYTWYNPL